MMGSSFSLSSSAPIWWVQFQPEGPTSPPSFHHLIASTATSLRLGLLLRSSFKKLSHFCHVPRLKDVWCQKASQFEGTSFLQFSNDVFASTTLNWLSVFSSEGTGKGYRAERSSHSETPRRNSFNGRKWTNILLAINILVFAAQHATQGKLLLWGAKVNSLIDKGQVWRLITSSFLHANVAHLMVNSYSLNSVGPAIENLCGSGRFLAIYFTSALTSSFTSYWFSKAPAVGASGAIFGLVGSLAVFVIRHREMIRGGKDELRSIAQVILLNMMIGVMSRGIDNWGHLGGLIGGVATSWFVGPAWKFESLAKDGRRIFVDRAPIKYLVNRNERS